MHLIWTILIGFVAGLIAKMLAPGGGPGGFFITAALGIGGSVAATFIGQAVGLYPAGHSAGFIASVIGAILLLAIYHFATRSKG
jgi:uncharacterized membrane protein YeaQ/YmgE (transglycosylase-associated protein family)